MCVPPDAARLVWPRAEYLVRAAVEATDLATFAEIKDGVLTGRSLLWLAILRHQLLAVATTELRRTEHSLVCVITSCAGRLGDELHGLLGGIENYARAEGCKYVRLTGRRGWARRLRAHYVQTYVMLERRLK